MAHTMDWFEEPKKDLRSFTPKGREMPRPETLSSLEHGSDFHDPFSDLSLFLTKKIKQEMRHCPTPKKWSFHLQQTLLHKIGPEFEQRFPKYRLGTAALKKTWEKVRYYSHQINQKNEALTKEGKLDKAFFIKENLRSESARQQVCGIHPYHYAHKLALKMSECIAIVDGTRPQIDHLTKTIWSVHRHLITSNDPQMMKSPYDEYDKLDRLIVKLLLEISSKDHQLSQAALARALRDRLRGLKSLPTHIPEQKLGAFLAALVAENFPSTKEEEMVIPFLRRQFELTSTTYPHLEIERKVLRVVGLYELGQSLPKGLEEKSLDIFLNALFGEGKRPSDCQELISFFSASKVLFEKQGRTERGQLAALKKLYQTATNLPRLSEDTLKALVWKVAGESENLLDSLPFNAGKLLSSELAGILIDDPSAPFSTLTTALSSFLQQVNLLKQTEDWASVEKKIHTWSMQGDMLLRWIRLKKDSSLFSHVMESKEKIGSMSLADFVAEMAFTYTRKHQKLIHFLPDLEAKLWLLIKHLWYTDFAQASESTFDRFVLWHWELMQDPNLDKLEELCQKTLPLLPFDREHAQGLCQINSQ